MRTILPLLAALVALPLSAMRAGDTAPVLDAVPPPAKESAVVRAWSSYVFGGDLESPSSGSLRSLQTGLSALFPVALAGPVRFSLGAYYQRFDFGGTSDPLPSSAVNVSPTITLEYLVKGQPAVTLTTQPGFQYAGDFDSASFDSPVILTAGLRFSDSLVVFIGGIYSRFREYPVLPIAGFIWTPSEDFSVNLTGPQISAVYDVDDSLSVQIEGGIVGGSYRVSDGVYEGKNLDYMDLRAGAAARWKPGKIWSLETGAGWSFLRRFGFDDGDEKIDADGAPYVRIQASASF